VGVAVSLVMILPGDNGTIKPSKMINPSATVTDVAIGISTGNT